MENQFDKIADIYDQVIPDHIVLHYSNKRTEFIKRFFTQGLVLDIGSGTGLLDGRLIKEGFNIVSLDNSKEMLQTAKKRMNSFIVCGDALTLPFKSNSFDLVISVAMLHHIVDKEKISLLISEMLRVLKPQGRIIIWDHNPLNPYWYIFMRRLPQDQTATRLIPLKEILANFRNRGITSLQIYKKGFVPDFVPRTLLPIFKILEKYLENIVWIHKLSAHNIIVAQKII